MGKEGRTRDGERRKDKRLKFLEFPLWLSGLRTN